MTGTFCLRFRRRAFSSGSCPGAQAAGPPAATSSGTLGSSSAEAGPGGPWGSPSGGRSESWKEKRAPLEMGLVSRGEEGELRRLGAVVARRRGSTSPMHVVGMSEKFPFPGAASMVILRDGGPPDQKSGWLLRRRRMTSGPTRLGGRSRVWSGTSKRLLRRTLKLASLPGLCLPSNGARTMGSAPMDMPRGAAGREPLRDSGAPWEATLPLCLGMFSLGTSPGTEAETLEVPTFRNRLLRMPLPLSSSSSS
mmetsp:Transcript_31584/g.90611  ORF Transcript_31584/g.90611 Transcript_31584/m.90611 type:complete len:251 (+) Transcript_31584:321-1073(+)